MLRLLAFALTLLVFALPASAWSYKEHILMTRLAAQRILADDEAPAGLKDFVRKHCPEAEDFHLHDFVMNTHVGPNPEGYEGLAYWAMHPDFNRSTYVPAFDTVEAKMHFIDLELFNKDPEKRRYFDDLSGLPGLGDIPRDPDDERFKEAGFLPFRVEQCYNELVKAFATGDDESAMIWAGYLAHYLQDNTQPHHATVDFRSHSYFEHLPRNERPNVHGWMEYGFIDDGQPPKWPELREDLVQSYLNAEAEGAAMRQEMENEIPYLSLRDPFESTLTTSLYIYRFLPLLGEAALAALAAPDAIETFATYQKEGIRPSVLRVKVGGVLDGVATVETAWRQAWAESQGEYERPPEHVTQKLTTRPASRPSR